jgi:hypothetical protein
MLRMHPRMREDNVHVARIEIFPDCLRQHLPIICCDGQVTVLVQLFWI